MKKSFILTSLLVFAILASTAYAVKPAPQSFNRQPFQIAVSATEPHFVAQPSFQTPSDKLLVIETVTLRVILPLSINQKITDFEIEVEVGAVSVSHCIPVIHQNSNYSLDEEYFAAAQKVRIYADPNTTVGFYVERNGGGGVMVVQATVSGYLVPPDSPSLAP